MLFRSQYRELASTFDHTDVFLFFLPANDFRDNSPESFSQKRYRPYLRKTSEGEFEVYYTVPFADREQSKPLNMGRYVRRTLYNNLHFLNAFRQIGSAFENSDLKDSIVRSAGPEDSSSYDNYSAGDMESLLYSYEQIAKIATQKRLHIFIIPREQDFQEYGEDGYGFKLIKRMSQFDALHPNIAVHDLLPVFVDYARKHEVSYRDFFLSCDAHWSPLGNAVAGEFAAAILKNPSRELVAQVSSAQVPTVR